MTLLSLFAVAALTYPGTISSTPAMRPDKQTWALKRHVEVLERLANATDRNYELVLVGDSITHRWENPLNGLEVYASLTNRYRVFNLGNGGDQTQNVLWRFDHGELGQDFPYTAKVFVVLIGVNNAGQPPLEIAEATKLILDRLQGAFPAAKIILHPVFPHGKEPLADQNWKIQNEKLRTYADGERVVWLDFNDRFLDETGHIKSGLMMKDNLHPIKAGYEIWLSELIPVVDKLLGR